MFVLKSDSKSLALKYDWNNISHKSGTTTNDFNQVYNKIKDNGEGTSYFLNQKAWILTNSSERDFIWNSNCICIIVFSFQTQDSVTLSFVLWFWSLAKIAFEQLVFEIHIVSTTSRILESLNLWRSL